MPPHRLTFRQRDVTAAIKAVERAGHTVARVRIGQDGSIEIEIELASPGEQATPALEHNPWDRFLLK